MKITKRVYPPATNKGYMSAFEALLVCGYEYVGKYNTYNLSAHPLPCGREYVIFLKNGKYYAFAGFDHFNTTIYWIGLQRISEDRMERMQFEE